MFEFTQSDFIELSTNESENYDKISPKVVRPKPETTKLLLKNYQEKENATEIGIIRQFPFSSSLQRMGVNTIVRPNLSLYPYRTASYRFSVFVVAKYF